jgi:hypothetical protein
MQKYKDNFSLWLLKYVHHFSEFCSKVGISNNYSVTFEIKTYINLIVGLLNFFLLGLFNDSSI